MLRRRASFVTRVRLLAMIAADTGLSIGSVVAAVLLRRNVRLPATEALLPHEKFPLDAVNLLLAAGAFVLALAAAGFYDGRQSPRHRPLLIAALVTQVALLAIGAAFVARPYPRTILLAVPFFEALAFHPVRYLVRRTLWSRGSQTIIVAAASDAEAFLRDIEPNGHGPFDIAGIVTPSRMPPSLPTLGSLDDADTGEVLRSAEEVLYIGSDGDAAVRLRLLELRGAAGFLLVQTTADALITAPTLAWIADKPLVEIAARARRGSGRVVKRLFDIGGAIALGCVTSPLMLVTAIATLLDDGGPVLIAQERAGMSGRRFRMWKFRTLRGREQTPANLVEESDERVTRVGYWLRRHRVDELPQLINVLRGEMSLVGPRPERPELVDSISSNVNGFALRLLVKPGMAGLAQVRGEYDTSPETKLRYDLTYICAWSLALDLRILLGAMSTSLAGRGR